MDWRFLLAAVITVAVVVCLAILGAMWSREKARRLKAENRSREMESVARRLLDDWGNRRLTDAEVAKKLAEYLGVWSAYDPPGISGVGSGS